MIKLATAKEMQQIDRVTIVKYGVAGSVLMVRAGREVVSKINDIFPNKKIVVLAGGGNNGGDGFVVARVLYGEGRDVKVFLTAKPESLKGDARIKYDEAVKSGVKIRPIKEFFIRQSRKGTWSQRDFTSSIVNRQSVIVDALLGTGLYIDVKSPLSKVILLPMVCPKEGTCFIREQNTQVNCTSGISVFQKNYLNQAILKLTYCKKKMLFHYCLKDRNIHIKGHMAMCS